MPTIRMPDGANVQFPDDMPEEQIRGMIQKKFPNTDLTGSDPGFWAGAGRMARGVATGVESVTNTLAPSFLQHDPELTKKVMKERRPPKDTAESIGEFAGEVVPSFLVPELGAGRAVGGALRAGQATFMPSSMTAARSIPIIESAVEGGAQGAAGGAMVPSDDRSGNAAIGAAAGAGLRGSGKITRAAIDAIPLHIKNTLSALASAAALSKMGLPWWATMFGHGGWDPATQRYTGSIYNQMYNAGLADLAARYFEKMSRAPSAPVGAAVGETKTKLESQ